MVFATTGPVLLTVIIICVVLWDLQPESTSTHWPSVPRSPAAAHKESKRFWQKCCKAPSSATQMFAASRYAWPRTLCLEPARLWHSQMIWNDGSSSRPNFLQLESVFRHTDEGKMPPQGVLPSISRPTNNSPRSFLGPAAAWCCLDSGPLWRPVTAWCPPPPLTICENAPRKYPPLSSP